MHTCAPLDTSDIELYGVDGGVYEVAKGARTCSIIESAKREEKGGERGRKKIAQTPALHA